MSNITNKELANQFKLLGDLMELHNANPFKVKSYRSAYVSIRGLSKPAADMSTTELAATRGLGKSTCSDIVEILATGTLASIEEYLAMTPPGIVQMLGIKGIGVKKIAAIWRQLDITTPGELLYACHENRLVELSGFGVKTQQSLIEQLEYFMATADSMLFSVAEAAACLIQDQLYKLDGVHYVELVGQLARQLPVVESIELGVVTHDQEAVLEALGDIGISSNGDMYTWENREFFLHFAEAESYFDEFNVPEKEHPIWNSYSLEQVMKYPPAMRELETVDYINKQAEAIQNTIENADIKGVIHNHTTASDGSHTLQQMVDAAIDNKYQYVVISDHSQAAFYAGGLKPNALLEQGKEIDAINERQNVIKVYKSVESDILNDGSLDYTEDVLASLDIVIASIHSNLRMEEDKANQRLIKAIENPFTRILGHPTGRLLLSRKGYPIDYRKIIDACAANHVVVELNANPHRLDIDWQWLHYCIDKGVMISINPDAHHRDQYAYMRYGVLVAQKAAFPAELVLNTFDFEKFDTWVNAK